MTEPKRWDARSIVALYRGAGELAQDDEFVEAPDFDRLREERDRLAERLREMIAVYDRHDRWCGHYAQAPGDSIIHRVPAARSALAAFDALAGRDRSTPSGAGQPDARGDGTERHHDTLTEEKT